MPHGDIREVSNRNRRYTNSVGMFFSTKIKRGIVYESKSERRLLHALELCPSVSEYRVQPVSVPVRTASGTWEYVPDILFVLGLTTWLCEVKHSLAEEEAARQSPRGHAARDFAHEQGWRFAGGAPPEGRKILECNLDMLMRYRETTHQGMAQEAMDSLRAGQTWTVWSLAKHVSPEGGVLVGMTVIYHLLAIGAAFTDLNQRLGPQCPVSIKGDDQIASYVEDWLHF